MRPTLTWLAVPVTVLALTACGGDDSADDSSTSDSSAQTDEVAATDSAESDPDSDSESDTESDTHSAGPADQDDTTTEDHDPDRSDPGSDHGSDHTDDADTGPTDESGPDALSRDDLRDALLTYQSMPAGWSEIKSKDDEGGGALCDFDIASLLGVPENSLVKADVQYAMDESSGPSVVEALGYLPGQAADVLDALRAAFADCEGDQVGGMPVSVSELDFPALADDSAAFAIHVGSGDDTIDIPVVYAVSGDLVVGLYTLDANSNDAARALLDIYAPRAVDRALRILG